MKEIALGVIKKEESLTNNEYDSFHTILEHHFKSMQVEVKRVLKEDAKLAIDGKIYKRALQFFTNITDDELAQLSKKQFKYVIKSFIVYCDNIKNMMIKDCVYNKVNDSIKFDCEIWDEQNLINEKGFSFIF